MNFPFASPPHTIFGQMRTLIAYFKKVQVLCLTILLYSNGILFTLQNQIILFFLPTLHSAAAAGGTGRKN